MMGAGKSGDTTSRTGRTTDPGRRESPSKQTQKSENPADDADPRRAFYNSLMKLQAKPPVRTLMRKISEERPLQVALSSTRPQLVLLLTPSGFQLQLGNELVGFFELPMFKAPREGLDGFDYEAIHAAVMKRTERA